MNCTTSIKISQNTVSDEPDTCIKTHLNVVDKETEKWTRTSIPPRFTHYSTYEERLKSYDAWNDFKLKPESLSEAGFFYLGPMDRTVCFHCGGGLNEWNKFDDPWVEHAYWFPKCNYVLTVKGKSFVDNAVYKKQETVTLQEVKNVTDALREIVDIVRSKKKNKLGKKASASKPTSVLPLSGSSIQKCSSDSPMVCKICFLEETNTLFIPCRHILACSNCASCLTKCPVCREPIQESIRVYPS